MILRKQGDGLFGSNMKIAKELTVKVIEGGLPAANQMLEEGKGKTAIQTGEIKEYRIIPHKIVRRPANSYR